MADEKEKAADSGGGESCEEYGTDNSGEGNTLQHLTQSKTLAAFLGRLGQHQIAPDETLYKEGGPILHIFFILRGRVEIRVADEVVGVVERGVLGAEESHFRKSIPRYTQTAVAVLPTSVVWLDKHDLAMVFRLDPKCARDYLQFQAGLRETITERLAGFKGRVVRLGAALEKTQNALLEGTSQKPRKLPPPPEELFRKWEQQCQTIESMLRFFSSRAAELDGLLAALTQIAAAHPDWAEHPDFVGLRSMFEDIVEHYRKVT